MSVECFSGVLVSKNLNGERGEIWENSGGRVALLVEWIGLQLCFTKWRTAFFFSLSILWALLLLLLQILVENGVVA